ncbi:MAG: FAD-binding oxidoreductase, partial [Pseudomonadota bacterium]
MSVRKVDVLIVGGGLVGTSTAFFLRQRGLSVVVLERDRIGVHASGTNFGNVRRQGRYLPQLPLANRSLSIWNRLPELLGEDVEFRATGHIRAILDEHSATMAERFAADALPYGLEIELLGHNAMRQRFPFFGERVIMGSFSPSDGQANPRLAAPAFARAAERAGASIIEGATAASIERVGDDFLLATPRHGTFRASAVQISAGAWGGTLTADLGEPVPMAPGAPQVAITEPLSTGIPSVVGVWTSDKTRNVYCRQVEQGNLVFGGGIRGKASIEPSRATVDPKNTERQIANLTDLIPTLADARVIRSWSGVEGYIDDDLPVMGPSARQPGLFYAFGFCGYGFQLAPGVGDVMAELIATGRTETPIDEFTLDRFGSYSSGRDRAVQPASQ